MKINYFNKILCLIVGSTLLLACNQDKSAYIDVNTVFSEFNLSQKLEKEREIIVNARQGILDSLKLELNQMSKQIKKCQQKLKQGTHTLKRLLWCIN